MKAATNNGNGWKLYLKAASALYLGAYVWLRGHQLFGPLHLAFAIVAISYACYLATEGLPKSVKTLVVILAPLVAIGLMLATA